MDDPQPPTPQHTTSQPTKLPRLSKGTKITKRPLLHAPIISAKSSASAHSPHRTIYVSARSPFISTTKRVQAYLSAVEKRRLRGQKGLAIAGGNDTGNGRWRGQGKAVEGGEAGGEAAVVLVKATGKAIDNALRVALFFTAQDGYSVRLSTGSVGAVDDIVVPSPQAPVDAGNDGGGSEEMGGEEGGNGDETPETRVRRTSMLEVAIQLK